MNRTLVHRLALVAAACLVASISHAAGAADDAPKSDKDGWYSLFNGKDLTGWKLQKENQDTIQVVDGELVVHGPMCHAYYEGPVNKANFKNFEWKCEILTKPKSNSGMYFHTKYQEEGWPSHGIEVQVNNSHDDPRRTASIYRLKDVMNNSPAKDNEWFTQDVIVDGNHITVKVNDKVVNEYTVPDKLKRDEGWEHNMISPTGGTFALQGHDPGSEVHYRKILVKPMPD